ncbi:tRNA epoxyqueuosine(34) reductase QueG [Paraclostridium bifermentans]|uniref:tRNA epoxyqueuosine(34) reductase QueG n=1 Tax=Paraclostridium bifermentans TaxID=1490 RepID=UPI001C8231B4|nr:tRNA epoxyqueuosine(34) reductase QueG [Paraclostridium bifermentans]GIM31290.1 epoxyqueuosine reductase [Paraclostridium bifermentans subsp. muricolitidis]
MNKNKLKEFCKSIGINCVGIAGVGPYHDLENIIKDRTKKDFITGMEETSIDKRINPRASMENAESIIVCAFPYFVEDVVDSNLSKYCYGMDYHIVVKEKLQQIADYIDSEIEGFQYMIFADNGPLVDRYLASASGIGYYGINNNIITDEYGSFVFIGYIINNYYFESDKKSEKSCAKCGKCITSCPGKAILGDFEMNPKKCLSYITQKKEDLSEDEKIALKNNKKIFGCDICQDVCPHNISISKTNIKEFKEELIYNLKEEEINNISNKEFRRRYKEKAFSWRGKKIIQRNIEILER